ncbi:MAG: MBL fold metallo-hydrolase [Deltaproteobacteria bacterium]|nr:MBL fold metallo-hydrolase [Deltaproteobacteria bacterium]
MTLTFLGAAGTVTGSKYLVEVKGTEGTARILVDCGLFQGLKALRLRNREPLAVPPGSIDAVVLTHAHLDHSGWTPVIVRDGFRGPVHCTDGTRDLCQILWPDAAYLNEEHADYANRRKFSKHRPAKPLFTKADAATALRQLRAHGFGDAIELPAGVTLRFRPAGHIVGAASVLLEHQGRKLLFSGDLGRANDPVMAPPAPMPAVDWLVVESTYGERKHGAEDPADVLADVVNRTAERGGVLVIPSFAVGRAQSLMRLLALLRREGRIPEMPMYLNSPMATNATEVLRRHASEVRLTDQECDEACEVVEYVRTADDSRRLNDQRGPMVIISASGMVTGGRILHHLKSFGPDGRNTILFVGYQAEGTRGASLINGSRLLRIHGEMVPIGAEVARLDGLSAHADYDEIVTWLEGAPAAPQKVFVTHGAPHASQAVRVQIESRLGWPAHVPEIGERVKLR